jgi:hypothetical protein
MRADVLPFWSNVIMNGQEAVGSHSTLTTVRPTYGQKFRSKVHLMVVYQIACLWSKMQ